MHKLAKKLLYRLLTLGLLALLLIPTETKAAFDEFFGLFTPLFEVKAAEAASFPVAQDRAPLRTLTVIATAYSSDPYQTDSTPCIPAMNFDLCEAYLTQGFEDTIAANFLPLGTKVRFPELYGGKVFTVRDRMNARYNYENIGYYRIDFYKAANDGEGNMDNVAAKQKTIEFGVERGLTMEVIGV
ncbi:MAG: hypothetical protein AAB408_01475 [Patescibacteria group bacterium]